MVNNSLFLAEAMKSLPPERRIALAMTPLPLRDALRAVLLIDARMSEIVAQAREPLLAQMRLAWWRERLGDAPEAWPPGEPLLGVIAQGWPGSAAPLVALADGWEELLGEAPLSEHAITRFAACRGGAFATLAELAGARRENAGVAGERWALADFAFRTSHADEREAALRLCRALPRPARLPRSLRGLAMLDGLAARAIARGRPLFAGRGAALAALRLGMFGR